MTHRYKKYKKAFKVACELLNGDTLYGYDAERIFKECMEKQGVVSSREYEVFILEHLDELIKGGWTHRLYKEVKEEGV